MINGGGKAGTKQELIIKWLKKQTVGEKVIEISN